MAQSEELVYLKEVLNEAELPTYSVKDGLRFNEPSVLAHPDFGKLTFSSPYGKNVVEVLSKRKSDERFYIDLDSPQFFYIEKSSRPINYFMNGIWRAIDPSMHETEDGVYESGLQAFPTKLNTNDQYSSLMLNGQEVKLNQTIMSVTYNDGSSEVFLPDWSNISIGNFSTYITEIFPDVDMKLKFDEAQVKSEYIIKSNLDAKEVRFIDELDLGEDLAIMIDEEKEDLKGYVQVYTTYDGETQAIFRPAVSWDDSALKDGNWTSDYELVGTDLHVVVDSIHLNGASMIYPLTIDPTFIAVGPIGSGFGVSGSLLSPAFCQSTMNVTFPGGSSPYDTQITWAVWTAGCSSSFFNCWMSEAQLWLGTDCGGASPAGAPGIVWTCPGCNASGSWNPTAGFDVSGTQSLAQCYTPDCADQTMVFDINLNRLWCTGAAGADDCVWATSSCQSLDSWSVTVQGKSVETLGDDVDGSGDISFYDPDCVGTLTLDPTPLWGVPPYSYTWSTGATSTTIDVTATSSVYTCDVEDACGNVVTATFTIGCPLDNTDIDLTVEASQDMVNISWSDLSADLVSEYRIERSGNDGEFSLLATVPASQTDEYQVWDELPLIGNNFYRIKVIKKDGTEEYTSIEKTKVDAQVEELLLIPNPSSGSFSINFESDNQRPYDIVIRDIQGRVVHQQSSENHAQLELLNLAEGVYQVEAYQNDVLIDQQRLILKK